MSAVELNYSSRGEGPAMLILHGLYGSSANWNQHGRWLAEHYRVIQPDLRNHGRSPHSPVMDYPSMAEDLLGLMDAEGLEQAILLGHSMGGKAAMCLALSHPERVRALVVADIAPVGYRHDHAELIAALRGLDLFQVGNRQQADDALAEQIPTAMVRQFLLTNLERGEAGYRWRIPLDVLADSLPTIEGFPALTGDYPGPSLFVHGAESDYVLPEHEPAIQRHFPQAEIRAIPDTGHWLHVERPELFAATVREFLESL